MMKWFTITCAVALIAGGGWAALQSMSADRLVPTLAVVLGISLLIALL